MSVFKILIQEVLIVLKIISMCFSTPDSLESQLNAAMRHVMACNDFSSCESPGKESIDY